MASQIQIRRDSSANWNSINPILAQGEFGLEIDTGKIKCGDGITVWNSLEYFLGASKVQLEDTGGLFTSTDVEGALTEIENNRRTHEADNAAHGLTASKTIYVDGSTGSDTTGEGTSANPYATIQKAINVAPRLARGNFSTTINIAPGIYNEYVQISYFNCAVILASSGNVTIKRLGVYNSMVDISCNLTIITDAQFAIEIQRGGCVRFIGKILTISRTAFVADNIGIYIDFGGVFQTPIGTTYTVNISGFVYGIAANATGRAYINAITGEGNTIGIRAYGGMITYNTLASGFATTLYSTTRGGRIYTGGQASVPSY